MLRALCLARSRDLARCLVPFNDGPLFLLSSLPFLLVVVFPCGEAPTTRVLLKCGLSGRCMRLAKSLNTRHDQ